MRGAAARLGSWGKGDEGWAGLEQAPLVQGRPCATSARWTTSAALPYPAAPSRPLPRSMRACPSDEHYAPSLLAAYGLDNEVRLCVMGTVRGGSPGG